MLNGNISGLLRRTPTLLMILELLTKIIYVMQTNNSPQLGLHRSSPVGLKSIAPWEPKLKCEVPGTGSQASVGAADRPKIYCFMRCAIGGSTSFRTCRRLCYQRSYRIWWCHGNMMMQEGPSTICDLFFTGSFFEAKISGQNIWTYCIAKKIACLVVDATSQLWPRETLQGRTASQFARPKFF